MSTVNTNGHPDRYRAGLLQALRSVSKECPYCDRFISVLLAVRGAGSRVAEFMPVSEMKFRARVPQCFRDIGTTPPWTENSEHLYSPHMVVKYNKNSNRKKNKRKNTMAMHCQYQCNERTGWSKNRIPSFIFGITSVIQHRF